MSDYLRPARALLSVFDKTGLVELGRSLTAAGVEILSTGGTAQALAAAGVATVEVSRHTGFPEMMDGRVKTLHPKIHGGVLALRDRAEHVSALRDHAIAPIDIVAINLYPFEATVAGGGDVEAAIDNIDIGGPALIRAAAKNHAFVAVLTEPGDYAGLIAELHAHNGTSPGLRRQLAAAAFARTAAYDSAIAAWFQEQTGDFPPRTFVFGGALRQALRYGENPHQPAAFYVGAKTRPGIATCQQLQGKELSYNNLNDTDAAYELVAEFDRPAAVIVKHANPCGVALGSDLIGAWKRALACDPVSAFGGVIAVNRPLDAATAAAIVELFAELVIAPWVTDEARAVLAAKKNLRLLCAGALPDPRTPTLTIKSLAGGFLVQGRDTGRAALEELTVVTQRPPCEREWADLKFAFTVCKHVKSNAIVLARDGAAVGIGGGQTSRVDAARNAVRQAAEMAASAGETASRAVGAVVASDAFFPFPDALLTCLEAGVSAAIQPGGAMRDSEVIAAADRKKAAMVFTNMRHFRH